MTLTRPWPAPSADAIATIQLMGDAQDFWEQTRPNGIATDPNQVTTFDAIGRDLRDRLIGVPPTHRFQMGDISDGDANQDVVLLKQRFSLFDLWCGDYNTTWHKIMGNHDGVNTLLPPAQWAAYWGYPSPCYAVDLGGARALVLNPVDTEIPTGWTPSPFNTPTLPIDQTSVAWVDSELASDPRPTIIMTHAPLTTMPTTINPNWYSAFSTKAANVAATDLLAVLDANDNAICWANGHSHNDYRDATKPNTGLFSVGSRMMSRVDAGAVYTHPVGFGTNLPVTFYLSVMDDGLTVDVRWRQAEVAEWVTPDYLPPSAGRFHRLTAT